MAEALILTTHTKEERYREVLPQLRAILDSETDLIANLANTAAVLREAFGFFWVGFYLVTEEGTPDGQLVLGPFQGPLACTRIRHGKGVCGSAWAQAQTLVVPDVDRFPGHIACSSLSRSEIVVPVFHPHNGCVAAVLDIDSVELNSFDDTDRMYLEQLAALLSSCWQ